MQFRPEQEIVPLAEGDAQSPQRVLDPRPLGDTPAVSGEASQMVQERVRGGALAAIGFDHKEGDVIAARPALLHTPYRNGLASSSSM